MSEQDAFLTALLTPSETPPATLKNPHGGRVGARFDVYRNNVTVSLTEALIEGFPTVYKLVGDAFFRAMAGVFLRAHPPEDPRLALYGAKFPGFVLRFDPAAQLPYLSDVARLDLGLRQSYHAADAPPLDVTGLSPQMVMTLRPRLAPATLVLPSRHAIASIWRFNHEPEAPRPEANPEIVLIARKGYDPKPYLLPEGGLFFARRLLGAQTLEEAAAATLAQHERANVTELLSLFLTSGALTTNSPHTMPNQKGP